MYIVHCRVIVDNMCEFQQKKFFLKGATRIEKKKSKKKKKLFKNNFENNRENVDKKYNALSTKKKRKQTSRKTFF